MVKEETNRIQQEENLGVNYRKLILIGTGILIAYFMLFGYNTMAICYHTQLHFWIFGNHNFDYLLILKVVISIICLILSSFGLYFFISGLRKMRKSKEKTKNKNLLFFIILYSIIMITANLLSMFELSYIILDVYIDVIPNTVSLYIFFTTYTYNLVVFGAVTMVVIIQTYFLKKNKLIDLTKVKRPVVHFFLLGSLIIWIFFLLNNYIVILPLFDYFPLPFMSSYILTSILAAGVYLELVIKVKKSKQDINIKS